MTIGKRVVVLTASDAQHKYVAHCLAELTEVVGIVSVTEPQRPLSARIRRAVRRFGVGGTLSRGLLMLTLEISGEASRRRADLARVLGSPVFPPNIPHFVTDGVNSAKTRSLLRELAPDIICVYGTYIVSDETLSIATEMALNLHTGISPRYRGAHCEFWPIFYREPEFIGATIHACTSALDGGTIFGIARAKLQPEDRLGAVFGRCVVAGSTLYKQVVQKILGSEPIVAVPQDLATGREYKVAMRGWLAELRVLRIIRAGLIREYATSIRSKKSPI